MLLTVNILQTITPGEWFTSIDLKDAYFHVAIAFQGQPYQFAVLSFSLSLAPCIFTLNVTLPVRCKDSPLSRRLVLVTPWEAKQATSKDLSHIKALGMSVNRENSLLHPTQQTAFIGLSLDSVSMRARPTMEGVKSI